MTFKELMNEYENELKNNPTGGMLEAKLISSLVKRLNQFFVVEGHWTHEGPETFHQECICKDHVVRIQEQENCLAKIYMRSGQTFEVSVGDFNALMDRII